MECPGLVGIWKACPSVTGSYDPEAAHKVLEVAVGAFVVLSIIAVLAVLTILLFSED